MPSSTAWSAMGAFLESAGASAQKITRQYQDDVEAEDKRKKEEKERFLRQVKEARALGAKRTGGKKIAGAMTAILSPMGEEEAKETLKEASPEVLKEAEKTIEAAGAAVLPQALPKQSQRWEANKVKNAMRRAIAEQESSSTDIKEHPRAKNGLQAYGKYGIVPELHIDKVGLNPKDPKDIERWKADKDLQEQTFERIIDANFKSAGGDVDKALELYYGKAKDKNAKQRLADGREMPSVNEYIAQVKTKMGDSASGIGSVSGTAGNARKAIDKLVSEEFQRPSKARMRAQEAAVGKLYAELTPEEIEQNKDYLDRVTALAGSGREEYRDELQEYGANLNRQTTAAINAMKLDEEMQRALLKLKSGTKELTAEEIRALESRRKMLQSMREQITDFTTRVGGAKPGARESILKTRPDLTGKEEPGFVGRLFGHKPKAVIDDTKIQKKLDLIDEWMMETDRALAGLGGLSAPSAAEAEEEENTFLSRPAGGAGALTPYLRPIKK